MSLGPALKENAFARLERLYPKCAVCGCDRLGIDRKIVGLVTIENGIPNPGLAVALIPIACLDCGYVALFLPELLAQETGNR